jgi:hypothetical protein
MLQNKPPTPLAAALLLLVALGLASGLTASRSDAAGEADKADADKPAGRLSRAEFDELKPVLDIHNQPWTTIPWKYSITEARRLAAADKKPIFMVVNTGNCLGCT